MSRLHLSLLGLAQIVSNGILYYAFTVLVIEMAPDLGISVAWAFGCLTLALLLGGLPGAYVGRVIDRHGARAVMLAGTVLASLSFTGLYFSTGIIGLAISLCLLQIASNMVLYEAVFPAITQIDTANSRRLISIVTLFGGFASTVFLPLTQLLMTQYGWRSTCLLYAAIQLLVCCPCYIVTLREAKPLPSPVVPPNQTRSEAEPETGNLRSLMLVTAAFCLMSFCYNAVNFNLVAALAALGVPVQNAASFGALVGPSSVLARLMEMTGGARLKPVYTAYIAVGLLALAALLPAIMPAGSVLMLAAFMLIFGASQGVFSIVRATLPLSLFGAYGYGARLGAINTARRFFIAASPFTFSAMIENFTAPVAFGILSALAIVALGLLMAIPGGAKRG